MKKWLFVVLLLGGCTTDGCFQLTESTLNACAKACGARGIRSVSEGHCECQGPQ